MFFNGEGVSLGIKGGGCNGGKVFLGNNFVDFGVGFLKFLSSEL